MRSSVTNGSRGSISSSQNQISHQGSVNALNSELLKTQSQTSKQRSGNSLNKEKNSNDDFPKQSHESMGTRPDIEGVPLRRLSKPSKTKLAERGRSATTTALMSSDIMSVERRKKLAEKMSNHESISSKLKLSKGDSGGHNLPVETESLLSALDVTNNDKPNLKHDMIYTKIFLQKQGLYNLSIWSHLTDVLNKIIAEQPPNVIDYFEEYSRKVKEERLITHNSLRDIYVPPPHLEIARNLLSLINTYGVKEDVEEPDGEEEGVIVSSNQMDLEEVCFYMHKAGIAIPDTILFLLNISMKKLAEDKSLQKPRFWGIVHGTQRDYFVFECELTDEEYVRRNEEEEQAEAAEAEQLEAEKIAAEEEAKGSAEERKITEEKVKETEKKSNTDEEKQSKRSSGSAEEPIGIEENMGQTENEIEEMETVPDTQTSLKTGHEVTFDLPEQEMVQDEEQDDPLLPPLPPPKKLLKYKIPPLLQPVKKEVIKVPAEKFGSGLNKKVYYVSNYPEVEWIELPKVTPQEISIARQIKVYMTGDLESKIITYPEFPGTERNYLRAQIARISASTLVSPLGYYKFGAGGGGDEEEEEEEVGEEGEESGAEKTNFVENSKFQPIPVKELIDPSLASWVHHSQHILKQGRTSWWNLKKVTTGEEEAEEEQEEEEEEEEGKGGIGGEERERGPPLLSPLSEDASIEDSPAWSVAKTHDYNNNLAGTVIRSNLWPGAHAFAFGKKTENVYTGWGHKHMPHGFSPIQLPHPEYEYELGPEIMEIQDPTVEVEQAWRVANKKKPPSVEGEEEGEGEENEEEEEEDEDDD